jgi:hypothetical protein
VLSSHAIPRTAQKATGDLITSSLWNAGAPAIATFALNVPIFRGRQTVTASPIQGSWVVVTLNVTDIDTEGGHSNTVNNDRYTCQVPGWYWVEGYTAYTTGGTPNPSRFEVAVAKNNTIIPGSATFTAYQDDLQSIVAATLVQLAVGDFVGLQTRQNTSFSLSWFDGSDLANCMNLFWVSR